MICPGVKPFLSFTEEHVEEIVLMVKDGLKDALSLRAKESNVGYNKFSIEIARLKSEIGNLKTDLEEQLMQRLDLLPLMVNLPSIFQKASLNQQHSILNRESNRVSLLSKVRLEHSG